MPCAPRSIACGPTRTSPSPRMTPHALRIRRGRQYSSLHSRWRYLRAVCGSPHCRHRSHGSSLCSEPPSHLHDFFQLALSLNSDCAIAIKPHALQIPTLAVEPLVELNTLAMTTYPDELFTAKQTVKIALVSIRAYRFYLWQSHSRLLRAHVTLLVAYCWGTPFLMALCRYTKAKRRVSCYFLDMILDLTVTLAISAAVAWPTLPIFGKSIIDLTTSDTEHVSFTKVALQRNALQGIVQSWFDVANTVAFSVLLLAQTFEVKSLLQNSRWGMVDAQICEGSDSVETRKRTQLRKAFKLVRLGGVVWGFVVAAAHIATELRANYPWCAAQGSPWFSTAIRCIPIKYFCADYGLSASHSAISTVLSRVDATYTKSVGIRNCETLQIPPSIRNLVEITDFSTQNATISVWDADAAIRNGFFPKLQSVGIVDTPLDELPLGLCCSWELPHSLTSIWLRNTNLSVLPNSVERVWRYPMSISLENNRFTSVPDVVQRIAATMIWLDGTQITEVPPGFLIRNGSRAFIALASNPIAALPSELPVLENDSLPGLDLSFTSLEFLPQWVTRATVAIVGGTPFCDRFGYLEPDTRGQKLSLAGMEYIEPLMESGQLEC